MTQDEFIKMVVNNHKTNQWIIGHFDVDGMTIAIKAFNRWAQVIQKGDIRTSTSGYAKTNKAFAEELRQALESLRKC